jgi:ribosome-binding factor A
MAQPIKIQRVARLLQKVLGEILIQEIPQLLSNHVVTVTEVNMSPDLGLAKVYLSFMFGKDGSDMLAKVQQRKGVFRKLLGDRVGNKLRKVPELKFYIDNSAAHAAEMYKLLSGLDIPEYSDDAV